MSLDWLLNIRGLATIKPNDLTVLLLDEDVCALWCSFIIDSENSNLRHKFPKMTDLGHFLNFGSYHLATIYEAREKKMKELDEKLTSEYTSNRLLWLTKWRMLVIKSVCFNTSVSAADMVLNNFDIVIDSKSFHSDHSNLIPLSVLTSSENFIKCSKSEKYSESSDELLVLSVLFEIGVTPDSFVRAFKILCPSTCIVSWALKFLGFLVRYMRIVDGNKTLSDAGDMMWIHVHPYINTLCELIHKSSNVIEEKVESHDEVRRVDKLAHAVEKVSDKAIDTQDKQEDESYEYTTIFCDMYGRRILPHHILFRGYCPNFIYLHVGARVDVDMRGNKSLTLRCWRSAKIIQVCSTRILVQFVFLPEKFNRWIEDSSFASELAPPGLLSNDSYSGLYPVIDPSVLSNKQEVNRVNALYGCSIPFTYRSEWLVKDEVVINPVKDIVDTNNFEIINEINL
ncbi:MAG: hypothetical protein Sylvanvirus1_73 [Sylvanvirus sp.]|uniref:Uncharacterized protein n=1 Tax=Sylvanvirus sp. TaxID=2487774 RepID=A0A3G5AH09_9VIRU|nr:MAG: hypothetical protein Sylvanvirus1_73 [Sylvanvirus sp.]